MILVTRYSGRSCCIYCFALSQLAPTPSREGCGLWLGRPCISGGSRSSHIITALCGTGAALGAALSCAAVKDDRLGVARAFSAQRGRAWCWSCSPSAWRSRRHALPRAIKFWENPARSRVLGPGAYRERHPPDSPPGPGARGPGLGARGPGPGSKIRARGRGPRSKAGAWARGPGPGPARDQGQGHSLTPGPGPPEPIFRALGPGFRPVPALALNGRLSGLSCRAY